MTPLCEGGLQLATRTERGGDERRVGGRKESGLPTEQGESAGDEGLIGQAGASGGDWCGIRMVSRRVLAILRARLSLAQYGLQVTAHAFVALKPNAKPGHPAPRSSRRCDKRRSRSTSRPRRARGYPSGLDARPGDRWARRLIRCSAKRLSALAAGIGSARVNAMPRADCRVLGPHEGDVICFRVAASSESAPALSDATPEPSSFARLCRWRRPLLHPTDAEAGGLLHGHASTPPSPGKQNVEIVPSCSSGMPSPLLSWLVPPR
jgi:hypothetical protein